MLGPRPSYNQCSTCHATNPMAYTPEQLDTAYQACAAFARDRISRAQASEALVQALGMTESTAYISANSARHLLRGQRYRRTMNGALTRGLLERIYREAGQTGLKTALVGLAAHIAYFEEAVSPTPQQRAIHAEFTAILVTDRSAIPQEVTSTESSYPEGAVERILVNKYERNRDAREACIAAHGSTCAVCEFNFEKAYGDLGKGFIHVHHLVEISSIGKEYLVQPVTDMRPVCPNCHAMLHKERPALTIEALKAKLRR